MKIERVSEDVKSRSNQYLLGCFDIHDMFIDHYEYTCINQYVSLREIISELKGSTNFHLLSKLKQRHVLIYARIFVMIYKHIVNIKTPQ